MTTVASQPQPKKKRALTARPGLARTSLRILIVAESESEFESLRELCLRSPHPPGAVHWLGSVAAARDAALSKAYDVVLATNESLGLSLLRELARDGGTTPVIVIAAGPRDTRDAAGVTCAFLPRSELRAGNLQEAIAESIRRAEVARARQRDREWWRSNGPNLARALRAGSSSGSASSNVVDGFLSTASGFGDAPAHVAPLPVLHMFASPGSSDPGRPQASAMDGPMVGNGFASTNLLPDLLAHLPVIALRIDDDGLIRQCAGMGLQALGLDPAEVCGRNVFAHAGVDGAAIRQAMHGTPVTFMHSLRRDGRMRHFECHVRRDDSRRQGAIGFAFDVTDRIEASPTRPSDRAEPLAARALRRLPAVAGRLDATGRVTELEGEGLAHRGFDPRRLHGTRLAEHFPAGRDAVARALAGHASQFEIAVDDGHGQEGRIAFHLFRDGVDDDGAIFFAQDVSSRRGLERELLQAVDAERQRIGADLHDEVGQLLTGIACLSKALANRLQERDGVGAEDAATVADVANEALTHTRLLARGLVPGRVAAAGLAVALEELRSQIERMHGVEVQLDLPANGLAYDPETAAHLFRIVQEATANAVRHGNATHVAVSFRTTDARHCVVVEDNGRGFDPAGPLQSCGAGLGLMRYRATLIGGCLQIASQPAHGVRIEVTYPQPESCPHEKAC